MIASICIDLFDLVIAADMVCFGLTKNCIQINGFVTNMSDWMAASDTVITKVGSLDLSYTNMGHVCVLFLIEKYISLILPIKSECKCL